VTHENVKGAFETAENQPSLQGLVDRAKSNLGAPLEPQTLVLLRELKRSDPAAFEKLRAELKRIGVRVRELDKTIAREADSGERDPIGADTRIGQGRSFAFSEPEPWPEPVDCVALLDELETIFGRFIVCESVDRVAMTLWCCAAWFEAAVQVAPILKGVLTKDGKAPVPGVAGQKVPVSISLDFSRRPSSASGTAGDQILVTASSWCPHQIKYQQCRSVVVDVSDPSVSLCYERRMASSFEDSKRIKAFRRDLIAAVPRFPNDKASLQAVEAKSLTDLLVIYIAWRLRHVGARPRNVIGRDALSCDPRATALKPNIEAFLKAVEDGSDLTPYLSLEPRSRGYTPGAEGRGTGNDSWADKDFLLNVMGLHHFHLGLTMEAAGHAARTNELLFASVTRENFEILGLFDHAAFEHEDDGTMTPERQKLWSLYEAREAAHNLPGQLSIGGFGNLGVTTSSHPIAVVMAAQDHVPVLREIDPKLDDPNYVRSVYSEGSVPSKPKLKWCYRHLDLGLLDEADSFFAVRYGQTNGVDRIRPNMSNRPEGPKSARNAGHWLTSRVFHMF